MVSTRKSQGHHVAEIQPTPLLDVRLGRRKLCEICCPSSTQWVLFFARLCPFNKRLRELSEDQGKEGADEF